MYCSFCGSEVEESDNFCWNCRAPLRKHGASSAKLQILSTTEPMYSSMSHSELEAYAIENEQAMRDEAFMSAYQKKMDAVTRGDAAPAAEPGKLHGLYFEEDFYSGNIYKTVAENLPSRRIETILDVALKTDEVFPPRMLFYAISQ